MLIYLDRWWAHRQLYSWSHFFEALGNTSQKRTSLYPNIRRRFDKIYGLSILNGIERAWSSPNVSHTWYQYEVYMWYICGKLI